MMSSIMGSTASPLVNVERIHAWEWFTYIYFMGVILYECSNKSALSIRLFNRVDVFK